MFFHLVFSLLTDGALVEIFETERIERNGLEVERVDLRGIEVPLKGLEAYRLQPPLNYSNRFVVGDLVILYVLSGSVTFESK